MRPGSSTCVFVLAVLAGLGSASEVPAAAPTSTEIAAAIEGRLLDEGGVSAEKIAVRAKHGIVVLAGTVETLLVRQRAAAFAGTVAGVRSVVNLVRVAPANRPAEDVQGDVNAALAADPATAGQPIQVSDIGGTVTLGGHVGSAAEKHLADLAAMGVPGVQRLWDALVVTSLQPRPAQAIETDVRQALTWDPWLSGRPIKVGVDADNIILSGAVASAYEERHAEKLAAAGGVTEVIDRLRVDTALLRRDESLSPDAPDAAIAAALGAAFQADPRLRHSRNGLHVNVAGGGQVFLSGTVADYYAKDAARQDARNTVGVRRVIDGTEVAPAARPSDAALHGAVQQALLRDPYIALDDIDVSVRNGRVLLRGIVPSRLARQHAAAVTGQVNGVTAVSNRLTVLREPRSLAAAPQPRDRDAQ